jgi:hypothetical protein
MVWMIQVDGLVLDARYLRREIQEEAGRRGLIPYIPGGIKPSRTLRTEGTTHE